MIGYLGWQVWCDKCGRPLNPDSGKTGAEYRIYRNRKAALNHAARMGWVCDAAGYANCGCDRPATSKTSGMVSGVGYYRVGQAAQVLGASNHHIRRLCEGGFIEAVQTTGKHWRIPVLEVMRLQSRGLPDIPDLKTYSVLPVPESR